MSKDSLKDAIEQAKKSVKAGHKLTKEEAIEEALELMDRAKTCLFGSNGADGFPYIKAFMNMRHDGYKRVWFSTNTSSQRVQQLKEDNRASVYFVDDNTYQGLLLVGTVEILQDMKSRKLLWTEGAELYYPKGVTDPDYTVLRFTAQKFNYYHAGIIKFEIK